MKEGIQMSKLSYSFNFILSAVILYFVFISDIIPEFIKCMIVSICLVFFISPRSWFWLKNINICRKPHHDGPPNKEKLDVLTMLLRLRYLEIYNMYAEFRHRQQEAGDENWILSYLKEEASHLSEIEFYSDKKFAIIAKKEKKAKEVFDRLFNFNKLYNTDKEIKNLTDLEIEFFPLTAITKLPIIRSFGFFKSELDDLIRNYQFLDDTYQDNFSNRFDDFKINKLGKEERRVAYQSIRNGWFRLFNKLKAYLIFFNNQDNMKQFCDSLFIEIEILEEMTSRLSSALIKNSFCGPNRTTEKKFFEKIDTNPLWKKSFL